MMTSVHTVTENVVDHVKGKLSFFGYDCLAEVETATLWFDQWELAGSKSDIKYSAESLTSLTSKASA